MSYLLIYAPLDGFVWYLARGWKFGLVVEPMVLPHGQYSVLMMRAEDPA